MTWSLGQHPNILALEETHFIYKLSVDLNYEYEIGIKCGERSCLGLSRVGKKQFYNYFGDSVNKLILSNKDELIKNVYKPKYSHLRTPNIELIRSPKDPKVRWVDGTPENSHYVYALLRLFPEAKFIHILRNPKQVANSLMHFSTLGQEDYLEEQAYKTWMGLVSDCFLAEKAFGSKRILRVNYDDIKNNKKEVIANCLSFINEDFCDDCLLPLKEKVNSSKYSINTDYSIEGNINSSKKYIKRAFELFNEIINAEVTSSIDLKAYRTLRKKYIDYSNSLRPDTNQYMSDKIVELEKDLINREKEIKNLEMKLKKIKNPLIIENFGPELIKAGIPFNVQPNSESAIWVKCKGATPNTKIFLDDIEIQSSVHEDGNLVTALVEKHLYEKGRVYQLTLKDINTNEKSNSMKLVVQE